MLNSVPMQLLKCTPSCKKNYGIPTPRRHDLAQNLTGVLYWKHWKWSWIIILVSKVVQKWLISTFCKENAGIWKITFSNGLYLRNGNFICFRFNTIYTVGEVIDKVLVYSSQKKFYMYLHCNNSSRLWFVRKRAINVLEF